MKEKIVLLDAQREIMSEFYASPARKILLGKMERKTLWNAVKKHSVPDPLMKKLQTECPALHHQIVRHETEGHNVQSAVFSECVYAQALADVFKLSVFRNCYEDASFLPKKVADLLKTYLMVARYAYLTPDGNRMLIQAGGCGGVDSALITIINWKAYTIEFKEPGAKTSEPDLPKYGEDGALVVTDDFLTKYPQFEAMLKEQEGLNFFKVIGSNVHGFSPASINAAVTENYQAKKFADVLCTEDKKARLVMLPINQAPLWAHTEGEIRPAGRNHYAVWTPKALEGFLLGKSAAIEDGQVKIAFKQLPSVKPRGGSGVSRYKINPLFFVWAEDVQVNAGIASFPLRVVRQLNPTIAGKMFFRNLNYNEVKAHYFG